MGYAHAVCDEKREGLLDKKTKEKNCLFVAQFRVWANPCAKLTWWVIVRSEEMADGKS